MALALSSDTASNRSSWRLLAAALGGVALSEAGRLVWQSLTRRKASQRQLLDQILESSAVAVPSPSAPAAVAENAVSEVVPMTEEAQVAVAPVIAQVQMPMPQPPSAVYERPLNSRTLLEALRDSDRVSTDSISGPFQMNTAEEMPVVCFQFRMSHFTCKAYLAHGTQDEGGPTHVKLQTVFEDNRRSLGEEQRYFVANEWNATKRYTRLKCGSGGHSRSGVFTLEYDVLCPADLPHRWGLLFLGQTFRMWYTSMVACVMHIVEPRSMPFATHEMIISNTLHTIVQECDEGLQNESCPICFERFRTGEHVRRLPCLHVFHVVGADADAESDQGHHCNIDRHLIRDKQCPVCKTPVDIMEQVNRDLKGGDTPTAAGAAASTDVEAAAAEPGVAAVAVEADGTVMGSLGLEATSALDDFVETGRVVAEATAGEADNSQQPGTAAGVARGLPEQAAELEHAVRSLQSRWLQIQDVVAGMQQMLRYIEDSQSALGAARGQEGTNTSAEAGDANGTAAAGTPAVGGAEGVGQAAPAGIAQPLADVAQTLAVVAAAANAVPTGSAPDSGATAAHTSAAPAAVVAAAAAARALPAVATPMHQAPCFHNPPLPFTEIEKVCMAYAWRQRRAGAPNAATAEWEQQPSQSAHAAPPPGTGQTQQLPEGSAGG